MAIFDVMDFGAVGDGVADDRPAIQAAINAAAAAGGGTVVMPAGTFRVTKSSKSSAIELFDNVTLQGAGMGETSIKLADNQSGISGIVRTPYGEATENVTVLDLTIDGNRDHQTSQQNGFFCGVVPGSPLYDENITLKRVEIKDSSGYGFDPHEITKNLLLEDCVASGNKLEGFTLDYQIDAVVRNCVAYDNDVHGFLIVTFSDGVLLENCEAYGNGSSGLTTGSNSTNVHVVGGSFHDNLGSGIYLRDSSNVLIEGAEIYGNRQTGITVGGIPNVIIRNNVIHDNSQVGTGKHSQILLNDWTDKVSLETFGATGVIIENNTITASGPILPKWGIEERGPLTGGNAQSGNVISGFSAGPTQFKPEATNDSWIISTNTHAKLPGAALLANDRDDDGDTISLTAVANGFGGALGLLGDGTVTFKAAATGNAGFTYTVADEHGLAATGTVAVTVVATSDAADTLVLATPLGTTSFVSGFGGDDSLTGGAGYDVLSGEDGNDRLDGRGGADLLSGGNGDDTYFVGTWADVVVEGTAGSAGGNDTVRSSVDHTLAPNVEKLVLLNLAAKGTGNELKNTLTGNGSANVLDGGGGDDTLNGGGGDDRLTGGAGKDHFKFSAGSGHETITDFADGTDRLDFRSSGLSFKDLTIAATGSAATVAFLADTITVAGMAGRLDEADFLFA